MTIRVPCCGTAPLRVPHGLRRNVSGPPQVSQTSYSAGRQGDALDQRGYFTAPRRLARGLAGPLRLARSAHRGSLRRAGLVKEAPRLQAQRVCKLHNRLDGQVLSSLLNQPHILRRYISDDLGELLLGQTVRIPLFGDASTYLTFDLIGVLHPWGMNRTPIAINKL